VVLLALVLWWPGLDGLDRRLAAPPVAPESARGQLLAAGALVASPVVLGLALVGLALWSWNHRLRRLGAAMLLALAGGMGIAGTVQWLVARPRPDSPFAQTLAQSGFAFPSLHVVAAVLLAQMVGRLRLKLREPGVARRLTDLVAVGGVAAVALDRWAMAANAVSDIIGGICLGLAVGWAAALVDRPLSLNQPAPPSLPLDRFAPLGQSPSLGQASSPDQSAPLSQPWSPGQDLAPAGRRLREPRRRGGVQLVEPRLAGVVYNPDKFDDLSAFRRRLEYELRRRQWGEPLWWETSVRDSGEGPARQARQRRVDLVLAVGGDGTMRAVCSGLLGAAIPVGLIPSGTGNILARNLGLPLDHDAAFAVALDGRPKAVDLIWVRAPGFTGLCTAMAGLGLDAAAMSGTRPDLKKLVGSAAYLVSIVRHLPGDPFDVEITLDDNEPVVRHALTAMMANVGGIQPPFQLFPAARPDDGLLDVLVYSPSHGLSWAKATGEILAGSVPTPGEARPSPPQDLPQPDSPDEPLEYAQARRVRFQTARPMPFQVDGDAIAQGTWLEGEILPAAIQVMTRP
jgi:diacylglycerol kinase family enzyme/membrane-associated phospholipid phosphatase